MICVLLGGLFGEDASAALPLPHFRSCETPLVLSETAISVGQKSAGEIL